jgi:hypothetical protein
MLSRFIETAIFCRRGEPLLIKGLLFFLLSSIKDTLFTGTLFNMKNNKTLFYSILFIFLFSSSLSAWEWGLLDLEAEARVAYYHPFSKKVRSNYGEGWAEYQFEISKGIDQYWRIWTGVGGFSRKGHSHGLNDRSTLQLIPVSLGIKYIYPLYSDMNFYVGGAACYSFLHIKHHSHHTHTNHNQGSWGALVQTGTTYFFKDCYYMNVFADYFFQDFHFSKSGQKFRLDMNGYKIGVGLGLSF